MAVLVDLQQVTLRRVDRVLFQDLSVTVSDGDRLGIVGVNGTGKSTLLRVMVGDEIPDGGEVRWGRGARIASLDQVPRLGSGKVADVVGAGWEGEAALDRLGMGRLLESDVANLSGGQAKRVALARVLARPAEALILDEPTNHLDLGGIAWLEQRLGEFTGGLVLVSHDRYLLDRLTTRILELDRGSGHVHEGGYASYLEARAERDERAATAESTRRNLARRELAWLRRGAQARSRKPRSRILAAERLIEDRPEPPARPDDLELAADTPRLGDQVIDLSQVGFRYDGAPEVISGVELSLGRRERLGVVGPNGSGKTTLLELLAGRREPTTGAVVVGPTVIVGHYDQQGAELDDGATVQDLVAGPHRRPGSLADVALMRRFWFGGDLAFARVGTLSGGERRRLQLLLVIARRPNVLFLDEPTNDLDLETLRVLEDFLEGWPGALVVVSHDRAFLERTTERLVAVGDDGRVTGVPGGIDGWMAGIEAGAAGRDRLVTTSQQASGIAPAPAGSGERLAAAPKVTVDGVPASRRLRELDKEMSRLQRKRQKITEALTVTTDHVELNRLGSELADVGHELVIVEEEWLELAERAEAGQ